MATSHSTSDEPARLSLREQWDFVRGPLHSGTVNRALHLAGLPPLIWGAASGRLWLVAIGLALPALGHRYDQVFRFDATMRARARHVVWLQIVATAVALVPLYFVYVAFQT